ncbi:superoxide dismutase, Cu-Zn family [Pasteurella testudinis DSM 23072]|uniref:Superoxide dismutase [Cu-Zn] n=1 Tax=Pasteurella testudinis DSM 23072 TaxID=1122938 RepID=A0A1W1V2K1_9PAST|nr:superoxide dismutase family protein [Pasteurella testudinis]SMB87579.1 superoxide dismutase, Cu-Zn family [Pasteurella testudinis DSM 23072]SUB50505.1 superoxide dismutase [Pasteurella testudinis]
MKKTLLITALSLSAFALPITAAAHNHQHDDGLTIQVQLLDPANGNKDIGKIIVSESAYGLVFTPELHGLSAGLHGFHIHQNPSCEPQEKDGKLVAGLAAGGHWDPKNTNKHGFPWQDDAHLGDLPALTVNADGTASNPVLAPRLKSLEEIEGRSIMIHAGGDNHSDHPAPLGGGGARMACGVIK